MTRSRRVISYMNRTVVWVRQLELVRRRSKRRMSVWCPGRQAGRFSGAMYHRAECAGRVQLAQTHGNGQCLPALHTSNAWRRTDSSWPTVQAECWPQIHVLRIVEIEHAIWNHLQQTGYSVVWSVLMLWSPTCHSTFCGRRCWATVLVCSYLARSSRTLIIHWFKTSSFPVETNDSCQKRLPQ